jgi:hypothetical protein
MTADVRAKPKPRTALWVGLAGIVVLLAAGAVGAYLIGGQAADAAAEPIAVQGDFRLAGGEYSYTGQECAGKGGYSDIRGGTQVVVTDGAGKTIGVASLAAGRLYSFDNQSTMCVFDFQTTVPAGHAFYGVAVGKRGTVQYSSEQVAQPLRLTLG